MTTHVTFRLKHPSQNLVDVADILGLPIARIWKVGDSRKTTTGEPLDGEYLESYLALKVISDPQTIENAVDVVRQVLLTASDRLPVLMDPELRKTLYCTLELDGEIISLHTLRYLVELGIAIEIDGRGVD